MNGSEEGNPLLVCHDMGVIGEHETPFLIRTYKLLIILL